MKDTAGGGRRATKKVGESPIRTTGYIAPLDRSAQPCMHRAGSPRLPMLGHPINLPINTFSRTATRQRSEKSDNNLDRTKVRSRAKGQKILRARRARRGLQQEPKQPQVNHTKRTRLWQSEVEMCKTERERESVSDIVDASVASREGWPKRMSRV